MCLVCDCVFGLLVWCVVCVLFSFSSLFCVGVDVDCCVVMLGVVVLWRVVVFCFVVLMVCVTVLCCCVVVLGCVVLRL